MSYITNVIVHGVHEKTIAPLNEWLLEADAERKQQLRPINMDAAGGTKYYVADVWAAAFNYAPDGLEEKLRDPKTWGIAVLMVAVIIDGENGTDAFVFDKVDGEYRPVTGQDRYA